MNDLDDLRAVLERFKAALADLEDGDGIAAVMEIDLLERTRDSFATTLARLEAAERNEVIVATDDEEGTLSGVFFSQADLLTWMRENYHPRKDLRIVREGDNLRVLGKNNWPVTKWLSFRVHRATVVPEETARV